MTLALMLSNDFLLTFYLEIEIKSSQVLVITKREMHCEKVYLLSGSGCRQTNSLQLPFN